MLKGAIYGWILGIFIGAFVIPTAWQSSIFAYFIPVVSGCLGVIIVKIIKKIENDPRVCKWRAKKYLEKYFPGLLEVLEEAHALYLMDRKKWHLALTDKYRMFLSQVEIVGVTEKCLRLYYCCSRYPDDSWRDYFPAGWYSTIIDDEYIVYKEIDVPYGNVKGRGNGYITNYVKEIYPEWSCYEDCIIFEPVKKRKSSSSAGKPHRKVTHRRN